MPRNSFVQMSKLTNLKGRINYISNPARQENLYSIYNTATMALWRDLAKESQQEFRKSGTAGKCIEARELIIALPESYLQFDSDSVLKIFADSFKESHGVECVAALHHNKRKTNLHIHLIFSERTILGEPEIKVASRNRFYNEQGKHVRTKKEILDEQGNLKPGCSIIQKGEVYEIRSFSTKNPFFKSKEFLENEKQRLTSRINEPIENPMEHLQVYDKNSVYLATKKIGKNNPKESEIKADNEARQEWNQTVDIALVEGVSELEIMKLKKEEIASKIQASVNAFGKSPRLFRPIIQRAKEILLDLLQKWRVPAKPKLAVDISEFRKLEGVKAELDKQVQAISQMEKIELPSLEQTSDGLHGMFKAKERKKVIKRVDDTKEKVSKMKSNLKHLVSRHGYKDVQSFMKVYSQSRDAILQYQKELKAWQEESGQKPPSQESIRERLRRYEREAKRHNAMITTFPKRTTEKNQHER